MSSRGATRAAPGGVGEHLENAAGVVTNRWVDQQRRAAVVVFAQVNGTTTDVFANRFTAGVATARRSSTRAPTRWRRHVRVRDQRGGNINTVWLQKTAQTRRERVPQSLQRGNRPTTSSPTARLGFDCTACRLLARPSAAKFTGNPALTPNNGSRVPAANVSTTTTVAPYSRAVGTPGRVSRRRIRRLSRAGHCRRQ